MIPSTIARSSASAEQISLRKKNVSDLDIMRPNEKREGKRRERDILRPRHTNRPIRHIRAKHLERKPLEPVRHSPYRQHDRREEPPKGRNGHQRWAVAPVVGEDGEKDREDELDGCLRGRDHVDELDGVLSGRFQPEGEGLDGAGGLLGVRCQ